MMTGLKKIVMMANQIESLLPKDYIQLEYLESTGTQYIDTGFIPRDKAWVEIDAQKTSGSDAQLFYAPNTTVGSSTIRFQTNVYDTNLVYFRYGNSSTSRYVINTNFERRYYRMDHANCYIDGINVLTHGNTASLNGYTNSTMLFSAIKADGSLNNTFKGKVFLAKFGIGERCSLNLIPALRIADSKPGMYDLVSGQFFVNQGTGEFVFKMPNTIKPLPEEYLQLEYIQTNGNQYLDSQIVLSSNSRIEVDARLTTSTSTTAYMLCGNSYDTNNRITINPTNAANSTSRFDNKPYTGSLHRSGRHVWASDRNGVYIDNAKIGTWNGDITDFKHTTSFYILADRISTGVQHKALTGTRIYGLKVYDNGNPVANMVPVLNVSQNKPGLYDKINDRFLVNKGTGEFTYG